MTSRRIVILFLLIISPLTAFSQIVLDKEEINKNEYKLYYTFDDHNLVVKERQGKKILTYEGYSDPSQPGEMALPSFDLFISIPYGSNPSVELLHHESTDYDAFPEINPEVAIVNSEVEYRNRSYLKDTGAGAAYIKKGFIQLGDDYCLHLRINLFQINRDAIKISLLKKFAVILKFESELPQNRKAATTKRNPLVMNSSFASIGIPKVAMENRSSDSWINYDQEYLKIGINKEGICRIDMSDLISAGVNASAIDPRFIHMYLKGSEIPIFVAGESDGKFDDSDFIEFPGQRNMGGKYRETSGNGVPYKEYINRYSDTTFYWLTWNNTAGLRADQRNDSGFATDTLKYYSELIHIENNNWFDFAMQDQVLREMPYWAENKTWNEGNISVGTKNVTFTPKDYYPDKTVKVFAKLQDYASSLNQNAHLLAITLNGAPKQDSGYVDKYRQKVLEGNYNSSILKSGNNILSIYSYATGTNPNLCIADWYELEYPRYIKAVGDSLNFQFPFLTDSSPKAVDISNLTSSKRYIVWRVGQKCKRYSLTVSGGGAVITDSVKHDDRFFLIDSARTLKPKIYNMKRFVNLRSGTNSADYIAITHKKFLNNVSNYSAFISSNYKVRTKLVDVDDIYDEFAYGFFQPEAIRDFLMTAHANWIGPAPNYLVLIGGATYDYLGNKTKYQGAPKVINYVPSFGAPASDSWFVIWDTTGAYIPQMNVGRLPVASNVELLWYMEKHRQYVSQNNSAWNKRYIFFSGGTGNDQSQIDQLRNTNSFIINNYVVPPPIGGTITHFYKTTDPVTNFGEYTPAQFQSVIDSGSVFISYLGHSGTQTWDNSITDPGQLKNKINRYPFITDFGCSTAKFAEPDVVSFSQLFVNNPDGQAIGYIANSSLGFTSTSYTFPQIFYKKILADSVYTIGDAHRLAKLDLINNYGLAGVYKLFTLTNTLIGDPIVKLAVPRKPNLSIVISDVKFLSGSISDSDDSLSVRIKYYNYGSVKTDTFSVSVKSYYNGAAVYNKIIMRQIPLFTDSVTVSFPIKDQPGEHAIQINLDSGERVDEISETDNRIDLSFLVSSSSIKISNKYSVEGKLASPVILINPVSDPNSKSFQVELSLRSDFANSTLLEPNFDLLKTKIVLPGTFLDKRVWLRSRINSSGDYGSTVSFINGDSNGYSLSDSLSLSTVERKNVTLANQKIILDNRTIEIKALSAGFNDGNTALIQVDNQNLIPENTLGGHHVAVLEDSTYKFVQYKRFYILGDAAAVQSYINFLDTLSAKYLAVFAVSDEGSVSSAALKSKLKLFGSKFIDSLSFRGSWAMIGKKGAATGSVPERYSKAFRGRVQTDTTISSRHEKGSFVTTEIGPASAWKNVIIGDTLSAGSAVNYKLLGINEDESVDTLNNPLIKRGISDLSSLDAEKYRFIRISADLYAPANILSPSVKDLDVNYENVPELGTNYQVVSIVKDTLDQGETANLSFKVYNMGESTAGKFKVNVELIRNGNTREIIFDQAVDSLGADKFKPFNLNYNTSNVTGRLQFRIVIDPTDKITELYRDNNYYSVPFYVKANTKPASVNLTIDGIDILNGDYVSPNPDIRIELNDQSPIPINDTTALQLFLNNKRIYYSGNSKIAYSYSAENPKFTVEYNPVLDDGEYTLKAVGENATGDIIDPEGVVRTFSVNKEMQLLSVYNYPNPFKRETYFTFKLTQIPDELRIKIYTLRGRMIKELRLTSAELKYDFNKIYWDGKDADGDPAANGVYLYKVIVKKGSDITQTTQKLAIVR